MMMRPVLVALGLIAGFHLPAPASAHDYRVGSMVVTHPWARATIGKLTNGVAYMTIDNEGQSADRLLKVETPAAKRAALHTHIMENNVMKMRPVEAIEINPGAATALEPGGFHIMLTGLNAPLKEGQSFVLTLTFEKAGTLEVNAKITKPGDMGPGQMHDHKKSMGHEHDQTHDAGHMAGQKHHKHEGGKHEGGKHDGGADCHLPVHITTAAERRPGGALYTMPASSGQAGHAHSAKDMEGAHMDHRPRHGGAFFMAPNKLHHLEAVYSEGCGVRVVFYNAFIEPIAVDRFRGFMRVSPQSDQQPDVMRFLDTSMDKTALSALIGNDVSPPFTIELYVRFPGSVEPELFTIPVRHNQ